MIDDLEVWLRMLGFALAVLVGFYVSMIVFEFAYVNFMGWWTGKGAAFYWP